MFKKNSLKFGLLLGFIAPLISLAIYYLIKFYPHHYSLYDFLGHITAHQTRITAVTVPCLFLNIALFTIYINSQRDQTAKGIFAITLVYAIGALLVKFWI